MSPDEHDCLDFKEIVAPLTDEYLAMMANAAALRGQDHATVLVGIAEEKNSATGLTSGRIVGLSGDLHQAAETIAQRASMTKPSPVGIEIFEENVESAPILRVEITPTAPPHYDQKGRRATRQHTTTRAMSDEEILQLLEAREQRRYAGVAEETANLMMGDFRVVTDEMMEKIERRQNETDDITGAIQEVLSRIDDVEMELMDLPRDFDPSDPFSMERTLASVVNIRQMGLIAISQRINELSDADIDAIERLANSAPDVVDYVRNRREVEAWQALLSIAFEKGSDITGAVQSVIAAHEMGADTAHSLRDIAARFTTNRGPAGDASRKRARSGRRGKRAK